MFDCMIDILILLIANLVRALNVCVLTREKEFAFGQL